MVTVFPKLANQPNEMALTICNCFRLMRDWKLENLANGKEGCFPLSQNFQKFRAEVKLKVRFGSFRPEYLGPPLEMVLFDQWVWSHRNVPFNLQKFSFPVPDGQA